MSQYNTNDTKVAVAWKYLDTQLEIYNELLDSLGKYLLSRRNMEHKTTATIMLIKSLSKYYYCVIAAFESYIDSKKDTDDDQNIKITSKDYRDLRTDTTVDPKKLFSMVDLIIKWSQEQGPLATINEYTPADRAW